MSGQRRESVFAGHLASDVLGVIECVAGMVAVGFFQRVDGASEICNRAHQSREAFGAPTSRDFAGLRVGEMIGKQIGHWTGYASVAAFGLHTGLYSERPLARA